MENKQSISLVDALDLRDRRAYIERSAAKKRSLVEIEFWRPLAERLAALRIDPAGFSIREDGALAIGRPGDLPAADLAGLEGLVRDLVPWRKGPLSLHGIEIDAEWRANLKWDRLAPFIGDISGLRVADVGCNNGYYMFRLLERAPETVVGLDPNGRFYHQFSLLRRLSGDGRLHFEPLGIEDLDLFRECFDLVLCLGVIYHRRDPYGALQSLRESLRPGGRLFLETLAVPGREPYCLCPPERYAKMRNVWFVPTEGCVEAWLRKNGFVDVQTISSVRLERDEQRSTAFAPYESLDDFLDPFTEGLTVEGFPAPLRVAVSARRAPAAGARVFPVLSSGAID